MREREREREKYKFLRKENGKMRFKLSWKDFFLYGFLFLFLLFLFIGLGGANLTETKTVPLSQVIQDVKNKKIDSITVGTTPRRVVVNTDTNILYVSNQISNSLSVIDGYTNTVIDSIPVEQPFELVINPITNKLYATYFGYPMLSIVNDVIREQGQKYDYEPIIGVLAAGALSGGIAYFTIQKKKLKSKSRFTKSDS